MMYEKEARERLKVSTLLGITADLYRHLEVDKIMLRVMMSATTFLDAERFSLFLLDEERNELFTKAVKLGPTDSMRSNVDYPLPKKKFTVFLAAHCLFLL